MKRLNFLVTIVACLLIGTIASVNLGVNPLLVAGVLLFLGLLVSVPEKVAAEITIADTSYAGEVLEQFISLATTTFQTLEKGCINVLAGIKKKQTIPSLELNAFIQARAATPTFGGTVDIDKRELEPKDFMGYLEFNPRDFEQHWLAAQLNPKLLDAQLPQTAESAITQKVIQKNKNFLDKAIWQSVYDAAAITTALASGLGPTDNNLIFFDGFIKKMFDDADVLQVATPVALTSGNIVSKLEAMRDLLLAEENGQAVYDDPNFKFLMNFKTWKLYVTAQKAQANKGVDITNGGVKEFDGKVIVDIQGIPDNTIVACIANRDLDSNLWLGVNEVDEEEYLKVDRLANNSELWFIKMLYKIDVNYAHSKQTILYTTLTFL